MLVTFNIALLYINIVFRFLKQKVFSIKSTYTPCDTVEACANDPTASEIVNEENGFDTNAEDVMSSRIQDISCSPSCQLPLASYETNLISSPECNLNVTCSLYSSEKISEPNIQKIVKEDACEQNQQCSSHIENPANTTSESNSEDRDNYQASANCTSSYISESEFETDRGIRFFPPVYIQRYNAVSSVLTCDELGGKIKKVVEFGCAEMTFFSLFLKRISEIEEVIEVDIDYDVLNQYFHKVSPQTSDYIKMRTTPLKVQLYEGSVACTHACLCGTNAVICIELIEHLFPDDLEALPFTVFGYIKPQVAIFTTPNADFNVLFPGFSGFRHPDHKFEWSREQFQSWAKNLICRYPNYDVKFEGIGHGPDGTEEYGCCSQMAVFLQNTADLQNSESPLDSTIQAGEYKLLREYDFPVYIDLRNEEQKIRDNAVYYINRCRSMDRYESSSTNGIPLTAILENVNCLSLAQLRDILEKDNWNICKNEYGELIIPHSDPEDEEFSDDGNDYCWESKSSELQGVKAEDSINAQADSDEDWNQQCISSNSPWNLSDVLNRGTNKNVEIEIEVHSTPRLDSSSGCWTCENQREYNSVETKHVSQERMHLCIDKEEELFLPNSDNEASESALLNESITDGFVSSTICAVEPSKVESETVLAGDEICCNPELANSHSFDSSVYQTPCKSVFFCSRSMLHKSLSEEEETVHNNSLADTERTEGRFMHVFCTPKYHKESPDLHNSDKGNKMCPCCNSVLPKPSFSISEVTHKLLAAVELQKCTALNAKQTEEQINFSDELESNGSSEILVGHQDSCSACKAVDSGYPNTSSCQDMDMDLTPEQVDEILTENGSSLHDGDDDGGVGHNEIVNGSDCNDDYDGNDDNDDEEANHGEGGDNDDGGGGFGDGAVFVELLRPGSPVQFPVLPLGQNVENGDLVNNNQDNEGNNMVGQNDGEILEFEVQINENGDLPVLAPAERHFNELRDEDRLNDDFDKCKNV